MHIKVGGPKYKRWPAEWPTILNQKNVEASGTFLLLFMMQPQKKKKKNLSENQIH